MGDRGNRGTEHDAAEDLRDVSEPTTPTPQPEGGTGPVVKKRFAIVTMKVLLRLDYPWKPTQDPDVKQDIEANLSDALQYKDYVGGSSSVKVVIIEEKSHGQGPGSDKLADGVRDRGTYPASDGGGQSR